MLYIYKDRCLIFLCMLFFFIQINPNENESSCLISEWNFLWRGDILLQSGWILIYFQIACFLSEVKFLSNVYMVYEIHISNLIFSLYQYTRVLADRCVGGLAPNCHWKKLAFDFGYMKKKNIPPNLRSMIYLQELTQLVRRKSKLEFNKKPLEEGGGNGCFFGRGKNISNSTAEEQRVLSSCAFWSSFTSPKAPCFFVFGTSLTWWECWSQLILDSLKWSSVIW